MIYTRKEIEDIAHNNLDSQWILQLLDSHEELRRDRDDALARYRELMHNLVDKLTVREKKVNTLQLDD